jgi:probable HAF family extracellular repeat protein
MKYRTLTRMIAIALSGAVALPVLPAAQEQNQPQPHYTVTDLGTLGGTFSVAFSVNNKGWVDGSSTLPGDQNQHGFLWINGLMIDLGTLGGPNSSATFPLSERGQVPGAAETSTPDPVGEEFCDFLGFSDHLICLPFVWQNGVMTPLPISKLGGNNGVANEVNSLGQVVGEAENATLDPTCQAPTLQMKPVVWENAEIRELHTFPGDVDGAALVINDQGQIAGFSGTGVCANEFLHAFLWQNGAVTDLGNLGGTMGNNPQDINNQTQIVGFSDLPGDATIHGFLWQKGKMSDLETLPGDSLSFAFGISNEGRIVGQSCDVNFNCRALVWQNGIMTDLNILIPANSPFFLLGAFSINSGGQIVGMAFQKNTGEVHAFLAAPTHDEGGSEAASSTGQFNASATSKVVLPGNVRNLIREHLAKRYHLRGLRPSN